MNDGGERLTKAPGGVSAAGRLHASVGKRLRAYFLAGVLVTAPVAITITLTWEFIDWVDGIMKALIPAKYNPASYLPFATPGLGILIAFVVLTVIGALTASFLGKSIQRFGERLLDKVPVIRSVYKTVKQLFETVLSQHSRAFREAVLVEYPRRGTWTIAFITGHTEGEIRDLTEDKTINVFVPTTPNPTSGFLLFVPRNEVIHLDMTVEEAIKMVVSGGLVTPPDRRPAEARQAARPADEEAAPAGQVVLERDR